MGRITRDGLDLLEELEERVTALHERQLERLGPRDLAALRRLLQKVADTRPV
jgi:hypothetical protein